MFAVIRIRGTSNIDGRIKATLRMLRLETSNNCVILPETADVKGMLQKTKDMITWGEIDRATLTRMLEKRLRAKGGNLKVSLKTLKEATGFDSFDALAGAILEGKLKMHKHDKVQATFRLTPPSKGFAAVNRHRTDGGDLGYRGKEINALIERMI